MSRAGRGGPGRAERGSGRRRDAPAAVLQSLLARSEGQPFASLARQTKLGRTVTRNALRGLRRQGLPVVQGVRGVALAGAPRDLLCPARIRALATLPVRAALRGLQVHPCIDSTNEALRRQAASGEVHGQACFAEWQSAGRGRQGRRWLAPLGGALCFSLAWRFARGPRALSGLGLAVGAALAEALHGLGLCEVALKWPNDLLWRDRKLGGILIELLGAQREAATAVIGVGLNLSLPRGMSRQIDQPVTDLRQALGRVPDRNRLAATLLCALVRSLRGYDRDGVVGALPRWRAFDGLLGRRVRVWTGPDWVEGVASGVDDSGAFCLDVGGRMQRFVGAEVRLRPVA